MNIRKAFHALNLPVPEGEWVSDDIQCPVESLEAFRACLHEDFIREQSRRIRLRESLVEPLLHGRKMFDDCPELFDIASAAWHRFCIREPLNKALPSSWQMIPATVHPAAPMIYIYVYLAIVPTVFQRQSKKNIPEDVTAGTLSDIGVWMQDYHDKNGIWGSEHFNWLSGHLTDSLYSLGRLQFNVGTLWLPYRFFRQRYNGQCIVLAEAGTRFRRDGQFDGVNGVFDDAAWQSVLVEDDQTVTGTIIHPGGYAIEKTVTLIKQDWECVAKTEDDILCTHIPASGGLDIEECGKSLKRTTPFFNGLYPNKTFRCITCTSWLMDPQLADVHKPTSNLVRWQKGWYLMPNPKANDHQIFERVFNCKSDVDVDSLPQDNSLRRAVIEHVKRGGRWRTSSAVIFSDSINWDDGYRIDGIA
ncbi:MAG: acyltransferase domain-containing protein [Planctomycetota bacterium]